MPNRVVEPLCVTVAGAGSWGTAVAIHMATYGTKVKLWSHDPQKVAKMKQLQTNKEYLPDIPLPEYIEPVDDLNEAIKTSQLTIIAVPSHAFKEVLHKIHAPIRSLSWITKGIDPETNSLLSDIVTARYGERFPIAILSGPSFAKEVAGNLPTAVTLASNDHPLQLKLHRLLHHAHFRVYLSEDLPGIQICGAVKNVLAVACGISDGKGYGANARAALITRGLAEMRRLGTAIGGHEETFMGLAGLGDLVLTCTDDQSRNRRFGLLVGKGISITDAEKEVKQVVEGKHNTKQIVALSKLHNIEMPICEQVHALLNEQVGLDEAIENLFHRPPRDED